MSCHAGPARHLAHLPNTETSPNKMGRPSVDRLSVRHQIHTHYHSTDIVSALTINLPHATLVRNSSPSALDKRVTCSFSLFCNRWGAGKQTPPPMHRSRRLGWACRDTPKEAKLHGRQCPSDASLRVKFPRLYSDASQTQQFARLIAHPHAGNLTPQLMAVCTAPHWDANIIPKIHSE